jgi:hypothetical protein
LTELKAALVKHRHSHVDKSSDSVDKPGDSVDKGGVHVDKRGDSTNKGSSSVDEVFGEYGGRQFATTLKKEMEHETNNVRH